MLLLTKKPILRLWMASSRWCLGGLCAGLLACMLCTGVLHAETPSSSHVVRVRGPSLYLEMLESWASLQMLLRSDRVSSAEVEALVQKLRDELHQAGHIFSELTVVNFDGRTPILELAFCPGVQGEFEINGERWFSAAQIRDALGWSPGTSFNYQDLYQGLYALNKNADVTADVEICPRRSPEGGKVVDLQVKVEDRFPLHGGIELANTGTRETSDWRLRSSLHYGNVTRHEDVLSVDWRVDPKEMDVVNAVSGVYRLPLGSRTELALLGGWSESDIDGVLPGLQLSGKSQFAGIRVRRSLLSTSVGDLDSSLGWFYHRVQNESELNKTIQATDDDYELSMPVLSVGFAEREFDPLDGRGTIRVSLLANSSSFVGASDSDDFLDLSGVPFADDDFTVGRLHVTRLQRLPLKLYDRPWTLSLRLDAQYSHETLPSSVVKSIGGAATVRGYRERELGGDAGVNGSVELRTPAFSWAVPVSKGRNVATNTQFLVFVDAGQVHLNDPQPGIEESQTISSAGLGVRFEIPRRVNVRVDVGFPFDRTHVSEKRPRVHMGLELLF